jgi:hypothetical protein
MYFNNCNLKALSPLLAAFLVFSSCQHKETDNVGTDLQDFPCYPGAGLGIGQCVVMVIQLITACFGNCLQLMVS